MTALSKYKKIGGFSTFLILIFVFFASTPMIWADPGFTLENVRIWSWGTRETEIRAVAVGNVDSDPALEIVSGGYYRPSHTYTSAQLCVWTGSSLGFEDVKTWYWTDDTQIWSVAVGDVDGDDDVEIVTGGYYYDNTRDRAQLCVWSGSTLALENVKTWYWVGSTEINSVAVGDVDGDDDVEIVTGGWHYDGDRLRAQLCVWDGSTLALENVKTWYWTTDTLISSVAIGNVDGDDGIEIVTGGWFTHGDPTAQLCVWTGSTLALERVKTWHGVGSAYLRSVAIGNVDGDGDNEIVTGGQYYDSTHTNAQLCVWSGSSLALKGVKTWCWFDFTAITSVACANVDADGSVEIVTGSSCDFMGTWAQLCVWEFSQNS